MGNPRFRPSPNCEVWLPKRYTKEIGKAKLVGDNGKRLIRNMVW
jgi:hypothetical protein